MRNAPLARFGAAFRLELRLICLHWSYPLLHLLWAVLVFGNLAGRDLGTAQSVLEQYMLFIVRTMISGVALFVAGSSYARTLRNRFDSLEGTFPIQFEVTFGRWSACTLAIIAFGIEPLILAARSGPFESLLSGLVPFLIETAIPLSVMTAFGWLLVSVIGVRRWLFPLLAALWIALLVLPTLPGRHSVPFAGLFNFTGNGGPVLYTELFGEMPQGDLPRWFNLFYLGVLGILLGILLMRYQGRHDHQVGRRSIAFTLSALVILLAAGAGYSGTVAAAQVRQDADRTFYDNRDPSVNFMAEMSVIISDYDLTVDLSDVTQPHFVARLTLRNRGTTPLAKLHLRLDHDLTITQSSFPVERDHDFLTITPADPLAPGATLPIQLSYSGAVWRTEMFGQVPLALYFANAEGVSLSLGLSWSPTPASFKVSVLGAPTMHFASSLPVIPNSNERTFAAQSVTGALLIGSPNLATVESGAIRLIAAKDDVPAFQKAADRLYAPTLEQVRRFFPDTPIKGVMLFGTDSLALPESRNLTDGWITVVTGRSWIARIKTDDAAERALIVTNSLITPLFPAATNLPVTTAPGGNGMIINDLEGTQLLNGMALFITLNDVQHADAGAIQRALDSLKGVDTMVAQSLNRIYTNDGEAGVIRALRQIRLRQAEVFKLPTDQLDAWLAAASHVQ